MNTNRKYIIAFIVIAVAVLAGVIAFAPHPSNESPVTPNLTLAKHNFGYFEMDIPVGSNFQIKNNQIEVGRGKVVWQNRGNFSNETDTIAISKSYTDSIITDNMNMVSENEDLKVYVIPNTTNRLYKVVRSIDDVDIIVSGYNLTLIEKMANSTELKDTSKLVLQQQVNNTTSANQTQNSTKQIDKNTQSVKNKTGNVETTTEKTTQKNLDKASNVETTSEKVPNKGGDITIGGGSFETGSELEDRTYAKLYLGKEHAGESVKVRIVYSRDGVDLNQGNMVSATIKNDGYVSIASADSYSKYPDYATVEVYDQSGKLQSTQGISLNPTSGTQYF